MNLRGQAGFVTLMLGVVFFVLGMALTPPLNEAIHGDNVMGNNGLDCSNSSISNQNKAICSQTDFFPPVFGGVIFGLGAMLLGRAFI